MRRIFCTLIWLLLGVFGLDAGALPLTVKEVSLMLRGGDSNAAVMQELSRRHFVGTLSLEDEQTLRKAGADGTLITQLNDGLYTLTAEQSAAAQKKMADLAQRRMADANWAEQSDAKYRAQVAQQRSGQTPIPQPHILAGTLQGNLVRVHNNAVVSAEDVPIGEKKLIAIYFSAHWCGPCRQFTPKLVDYYNKVVPQHPELEFVFVSSDRSASAMQNYMREANMPWPAYEFTKSQQDAAIHKLCGRGIPCLVLLDASGRVISNSFDGEQYRGPQKVLDDLDSILSGGAGARVAATQ